MQGYNVIAVFNETEDKMLMCRRRKNPYKGLSNLVGGKIEDGEGNIGHIMKHIEMYHKELLK